MFDVVPTPNPHQKINSFPSNKLPAALNFLVHFCLSTDPHPKELTHDMYIHAIIFSLTPLLFPFNNATMTTG